MFQQYRGLPRSVYMLVIANVINSMGTFVRPMLTLFLTDKLSYSKDYAGFIIMIASLIFVPGSLIGGKLVDLFGRKKVVLICYTVSATCMLLCARYFNPDVFLPLVLFATFWQGMASPALSALMADLTTSENRQAAFSLAYLGHNLGFALGPMMAGFLYLHNLPLLFILDGGTTLLAVVLLGILVPDTKPTEEGAKKLATKEQSIQGSAFSALLERPILLTFALIQVLLSLIYAQFTFTLPLQLNQLFTDNGAEIYGILGTMNGVAVVAFTTVVTLLTSKFKAIYNMSLAGVLYAIGFGMLFFAHNLTLFIVATLIWTVGEILAVVNANVFLADNTPASHRGRFSAIIQIISGAGFSAGPWIAGLLLKYLDLRTIWVVCFAVGLLAAVLMYTLHFVEDNKTFSSGIAD